MGCSFIHIYDKGRAIDRWLSMQRNGCLQRRRAAVPCHCGRPRLSGAEHRGTEADTEDAEEKRGARSGVAYWAGATTRRSTILPSRRTVIAMGAPGCVLARTRRKAPALL